MWQVREYARSNETSEPAGGILVAADTIDIDQTFIISRQLYHV
jgi:hypothetical protein